MFKLEIVLYHNNYQAYKPPPNQGEVKSPGSGSNMTPGRARIAQLDGRSGGNPLKHMKKATATEDTRQPATADSATTIPAMREIIGYRLRRAQLFVFQDFLETFSKMKLRPAEFSVLTLIAQTPGQKQTDIAGQLGIKRANFVALMDGLERRGLAERRKAETDKRSHSLHLTPEGERFTQKMAAVWSTHEQRMVDRLGGPGERDTLLRLLDRLTRPTEG